MILSILITVILLAVCGAMDYLAFPKLRHIPKDERAVVLVALVIFNLIITVLLVALNTTVF